MIPSSLRDIVAALLAKTQSGEANWQKPRFSGDRDAYIELGPYQLRLFESRFGPIVVKLRSGTGEELLSVPVERAEPDFALVSELLDLADPASTQLEGVLNDVRRLVQQAGPVG